jgi:wyosine [tRNA(Phe)-imidazoG37] synthetase (radical SAM superfamily)
MPQSSSNRPAQLASLYTRHQRSFETNRFVYPVLSRRCRGISVGVNLNPDKVCNFNCIYCQVDRVRQRETRFVDSDELLAELDHMLSLVTSGQLFEHPEFKHTPEDLRRLSDIAFSGDGEPTTYRNFGHLVAACVEVKRRHALDNVKLVLITNASMFHRPQVEQGLKILDENQGEIWAKLEAGTDPYYRRVARTSIPLRRILDNITAAARVRPLVIQALFMRMGGKPPPPDEQEAFCCRLDEITAAGGKLKRVQIYTVARSPAERCVTPLSDPQIDELCALVRQRTGLAVDGYYSSSSADQR